MTVGWMENDCMDSTKWNDATRHALPRDSQLSLLRSMSRHPAKNKDESKSNYFVSVTTEHKKIIRENFVMDWRVIKEVENS